jgi:hypothetical protein
MSGLYQIRQTFKQTLPLVVERSVFVFGSGIRLDTTRASDILSGMWESFFNGLKTYESVAIWLEGIALILIFAWDRMDARHQHRETLAQLHVSQAQADALIDSERAWILAEAGVAEPPKNDMQVVWVAPSVTNHGKTPGRILRVSIRAHSIKNPPGTLPPEPQYSEAKEFNFVLAPSKPIRPMKVVLPGRELQDAVEHKSALYIYGFIDYLDLGKVQRKTRFCFTYYVPPIAGDLGEPGFYVAAEIPAIYNDCT